MDLFIHSNGVPPVIMDHSHIRNISLPSTTEMNDLLSIDFYFYCPTHVINFTFVARQS